jgi:hypothetical protein
MNIGLYSGNYYDYTDDAIALERENDIYEGLKGSFYNDQDFPANARSLYFDPLNPPKGSLPGEI